MNDTISRQAAIDAIEHRLAEPAYQHTGEDWYVGMSCAESELYDLPSAQPETVPCDDAVGRIAVQYLLAHYLDGEKYKEAFDGLRHLPSAQPMRKKGKWIDTGSGQECSECGEIQYGYDSGRNFCPNCGVRMEEE